jgi:hypothetical protein
MTDTPKPKAKLLTLDALDGRSKNACFSLRKINSGLDSRQHVFSSVLGFPSESGYLLLTPLSFGDVSRNFRRTSHLCAGKPFHNVRPVHRAEHVRGLQALHPVDLMGSKS